MKDTTHQEPWRQPCADVALLLDGEHMPARMAAAVLVEASRWGAVVIRRMYGDWASPQMHTWRANVTEHGMRACHQHLPKKNAADIALTIDAIHLFSQGIRCFCLCSGESDYVPLVLWLREHRCIVVVIGQRYAPLALQRSCSAFVSAEVLGPAGDQETDMQPSRVSHTEPETLTKQHPQARRRGAKQRGRLPSPRHVSQGETLSERERNRYALHIISNTARICPHDTSTSENDRKQRGAHLAGSWNGASMDAQRSASRREKKCASSTTENNTRHLVQKGTEA